MRQLRGERGGIYLEALVALAILALAVIPILGAYLITPAAERHAGDEMTALNLARGTVESLKSIPPEYWASAGTATETVNGVEYAIVVAPYEQPDPSIPLYTARVRVYWYDAKGGTQSVTLATQIAGVP